jgi:hypothetical protein
MESMELVVIMLVSVDDMLSEELVQYHLELERNVFKPHQKVCLFPKFCF